MQLKYESTASKDFFEVSPDKSKKCKRVSVKQEIQKLLRLRVQRKQMKSANLPKVDCFSKISEVEVEESPWAKFGGMNMAQTQNKNDFSVEPVITVHDIMAADAN